MRRSLVLAATAAAAALVTSAAAGCAAETNHGGAAQPAVTSVSGDCAPRVVQTTDADGNGVGIAIDYVDAIKFGGRQYVARSEEALPAGDVGKVLGRVRCTLSSPQYADPAYQMQDGDATFVPVGSPIYAVRGVATESAVAAAQGDGVVRVYRVYPPDVTTTATTVGTAATVTP